MTQSMHIKCVAIRKIIQSHILINSLTPAVPKFSLHSKTTHLHSNFSKYCWISLQIKHLKQVKKLDLSETIDQLAVVNSVHCYDDVLWREDGNGLRTTLELEHQRKQ